MKLEGFLLDNDIYRDLSENMFKILNCNSLWVMCINKNLLNILVTDKFVLEHYWKKRYYLQDPSVNSNFHGNRSTWKITLGTDCDAFNRSGFLYDLHKMFGIEEFVSIEKEIKGKFYCFRFFTRNNRFVFINNLLNNMQILKYVIHAMAEKLKGDPHKQAGVTIKMPEGT